MQQAGILVIIKQDVLVGGARWPGCRAAAGAAQATEEGRQGGRAGLSGGVLKHRFGQRAYGAGERRAGSRSSASVSLDPAAKGWAVRACSAADSSPKRTRAAARRARCASEGSPRRGLGGTAALSRP